MLSRIGTALAAAIALVIVYQLYVGGNALLAAACGGGFTLAFLVYTARSAYTYRYLFPGLAGIAIFVVLPLVYTVWLGTTNYSSTNLLTYDRATEVLLGEVYRSDAARYQFTLHADGAGFRIVLRTGDDDAAEGSNDATGSILGGDDGSAGSGASTGSGATNGSDAAPGSGVTEGSGAATGSDTATGSGAATSSGAAPSTSRPPTTFVTEVLPLTGTTAQRVTAKPLAQAGFTAGDPLPIKDVIAHQDAIKALTVRFPDGTSAGMESLREFTPYQPLYQRNPDGTLTNQKTGQRITPNRRTGFYEAPGGQQVIPGFRTNVGGDNFTRISTDEKFRGPFLRVFVWTVVFAGLTVVFCAGLGMLLAELLSWEGLRFAGLYRILLFLPYAVPSFISILVFKGLFNQNFGEINLILNAVLGIRPNWLGDAMLARITILIVNTWLGYPYFMLLCMGLQKSIPRDLYEASAIAGAGPLTNFFRITWPLIRKPLTPLLVASFAYNFNNFVLIYLLTDGRPDILDASVAVGETDILVSYTNRIAFENSGQQFGLAAAISTLIFAMVGILSVVNLRLTRANAVDKR